MVLLYGSNGQGKTNILEALYMLAVVKSPRASSDRELVRHEALDQGEHSQISAIVQRDGEPIRVIIGMQATAPTSMADDAAHITGSPDATPPSSTVQKQIRVNGAPRRTSTLVGEVNAVLFTAQDLDMVFGPPSFRRRYLDILISQIDNQYLRAIQEYRRVMTQRNHLLKTVRGGRSETAELEFWEDELVKSGKYIMLRRAETVAALARICTPLHEKLSHGSERLQVIYRPSIEFEVGELHLEQVMRDALERNQSKDIAQGFTMVGPHRDDLIMLLDELEARSYGSRGQCRTLVLALKLAEAAYLREERGQEPILLLDDILSELDADRRANILDQAGLYQQCFVTAATIESVEQSFLDRMSKFRVSEGRVTPAEIAI